MAPDLVAVYLKNLSEKVDDTHKELVAFRDEVRPQLAVLQSETQSKAKKKDRNWTTVSAFALGALALVGQITQALIGG